MKLDRREKWGIKVVTEWIERQGRKDQRREAMGVS